MRADGSRYGTEAIDGLRGIAIGVVVLYHTWLYSWLAPSIAIGPWSTSLEPFAATGFLGVDLFFFVSGFCLFYPHARAAVHGGPVQGVRDYASRRFWKIVPSYALALVVTALVALRYLPDAAEWWRSLAVHAAFIHVFYWDRFRDANGVFWSLAVEVQFYLIFPLAALWMRRAPLLAIPGLVGGAFAYRLWTLHDVGNEPWTRAMPSYVDVFAIGMATALAVVWIRARRPQWERPAWLWTAIAIVAAIGLLSSLQQLRVALDLQLGRETWQVWHRTTIALLVAALALGSIFGLRAWRFVVANPFTIALSLISYNLYLWHGFVDLLFYNGHVPPWPANNDPHGSEAWKHLFVPLALAGGLAISIAVTYFVERPLLARFVKPLPFAFGWTRASNAVRRAEA